MALHRRVHPWALDDLVLMAVELEHRPRGAFQHVAPLAVQWAAPESDGQRLRPRDGVDNVPHMGDEPNGPAGDDDHLTDEVEGRRQLGSQPPEEHTHRDDDDERNEDFHRSESLPVEPGDSQEKSEQHGHDGHERQASAPRDVTGPPHTSSRQLPPSTQLIGSTGT